MLHVTKQQSVILLKVGLLFKKKKKKGLLALQMYLHTLERKIFSGKQGGILFKIEKNLENKASFRKQSLESEQMQVKKSEDLAVS